MVGFGCGAHIFDACLHTAVYVMHIEIEAHVVKIY